MCESAQFQGTAVLLSVGEAYSPKSTGMVSKVVHFFIYLFSGRYSHTPGSRRKAARPALSSLEVLSKGSVCLLGLSISSRSLPNALLFPAASLDLCATQRCEKPNKGMSLLTFCLVSSSAHALLDPCSGPPCPGLGPPCLRWFCQKEGETY